MNKRTASFLVLVVVALLANFATFSESAAAQARGKRVSAVRQQKAPTTPPPTNIGFLSATQIAAGGGTYSQFPAVMGDFNGDTKQDVATLVNTGSNAKPTLAISVLLSNGDGTFSTQLTATTYAPPAPYVVFNPMWGGDLNGDGKDDLVVGVQATPTTGASIDVYIGNGDGTFAAPVNYAVTGVADVIVWGTLTKDGTNLDFVAADGASPNGSIWTLTGKGDGTFNAATSVAFTGALQLGDPNYGNSFNPMAFADLNGDGFLDFAGYVANANPAINQVAVYLNNTTGGYNAPTALATHNHVYHACYITAGSLSGNLDLVTPNCFDNTVTVYVNSGTGSFSTGTYYPVGGTAGAAPSAVSIADMNNDGNNDVVSSNWQGADVTVLLGNGNGTLKAPGSAYAIGGSAHINSPLTPAVIADFNGDGNMDAVLQDSEFSFVYLQSLGIAPPSFRSAIDYQFPVSDLSYSVAIASGDFNGDGIPDFVVGNGDDTLGTTTGVTVFLSNADGSLQAGVPLVGSNATAQLQYVAVADFDGDGNLDIAATDSVNGAVQIFAGDGTGNFTPYATTFSTGSGVIALGIAVGDFNGDKKPDLAVVNNVGTTSGNVAILTNGSTPGSFVFTATQQLPNLNTLGATEITAADLNNDGKIDLVVPMWGVVGTPGTSVALYLGKGDGTFNAESDFNLNINNPFYATVGDFNGDGKVDLAVTTQDQTNNHKQGIVVALGNGDGTFQTTPPPVFWLTTSQIFALDEPFPAYVKAVDLNRDGKLDMVYTNKKYGTVGILYGVGDGSFYSPVEFAAGAKAFDIALADVNSDGAVDAVTSSNARDFVGVTVLLNASGNTTTLMSSASTVTRGNPVTFTATVAHTVNGVTAVPTGTVTFTDNTSTILGTQPLDGSGQAVLTTVSLVSGSNSVVAQYSGDTNYVPSTSAPALVTVTGQTASKTVVISSANPAGLGQNITFTATVTSTLSGDTVIPTGTVTFNDGATALGAPVALNASGVATFNTSTLLAGTHKITAVYSGDTTFLGSTSPELDQVVNSQPSTTTTVTSSLSPAPVGQLVTFTAKVASTVVGDKRIPTGTVTFNDGGTALGAPVALTNGVATLGTSTLKVGSHSITGVYSGDTTFTGSTSAPFDQVINSGPDYTLSASPTSSTVNPGSSATFTITVTPKNNYNGVVTFNASSCTGLPALSSCSFNPPTVTGSGTTTLTITTTGPTAELKAPANVDHHQGGSNLLASLSGVGVLGMILAGGGKKRNRRHIGIVLTILAVVILLATVGCGGGSSSGGGGGGTPAGTSTIQLSVTGTVNTAPHSLTTPITLTVN